jgi:ABC-2 type transport system ATP-binding protein
VVEYRIDRRTGVATYLQIVQQTKQAMRLGLLEPGDKLPTAREVVEATAINPNTVLKAYRELEREGLVEARRGLGTFIRKGLSTTPADSPLRLRARRLGRAGPGGRPGPGRRRRALHRRTRKALPRRRLMTGTAAIEAAALGKRFGRRGGWALRDCTFRLPAGRVCAVVGPNGAGKSTLLALTAGLLAPTEGALSVLGTAAGAARERVAYVAQDKPLYPQLTVAETLRMGADLNTDRWDASVAERVVADGDLNPKSRIRTLSGGQCTRVALALALAKRPELLLLDEPMADLDPLARHEMMGILMAQAAEFGTTIVMSSHVVAELEDSCDHLLLIGGGRVRLAGEIDELRAAHVHVSAPAHTALDPHTVVESRTTGRQLSALVRPSSPLDTDWRTSTPSLEELVLSYLRNPEAPGTQAPETIA